MPSLDFISAELSRSIVKLLTGRLLSSSQIDALSSTIVGRLFRAWLPESEENRSAEARVSEAERHIATASQIVADLKTDLDAQVAQLRRVADEIQQNRTKAEEYAALARADEPTVRAIRSQLEEAVRSELEQQSSRGRRLRQLLAALAWVASLLLGAAIGHHWPVIEAAALQILP